MEYIQLIAEGAITIENSLETGVCFDEEFGYDEYQEDEQDYYD